MAEWGFCPRGQQDGYMVSTKELRDLAKELKRKYIDEVIPVASRKNKCPGKHITVVYWEAAYGDHGWCCADCGEVVQWG